MTPPRAGGTSTPRSPHRQIDRARLGGRRCPHDSSTYPGRDVVSAFPAAHDRFRIDLLIGVGDAGLLADRRSTSPARFERPSDPGNRRQHNATDAACALGIGRQIFSGRWQRRRRRNILRTPNVTATQTTKSAATTLIDAPARRFIVLMPPSFTVTQGDGVRAASRSASCSPPSSR
jgi:hypothetical protein